MIAARLSPGAISESSSSHLPPITACEPPKPVMFPTRLVEPRDNAAGDGVAHGHKDDWNRPRLPLDGNGRYVRACQDDVGLQADQLLREGSYPIVVTTGPTNVQTNVATIGPTQVRKRSPERRDARLRYGIVFVAWHEHADPTHPLSLLCPHHHRPRRR